MNFNWLCKLNIHKYKFLRYFTEHLQYKAKCKHEMNITFWREKCERCGKEKIFNNMIR